MNAPEFLEASALWIGGIVIAFTCVAIGAAALYAAAHIINAALWKLVDSLASIGAFMEFSKWYHSADNPNSPAAEAKRLRESTFKFAQKQEAE